MVNICTVQEVSCELSVVSRQQRSHGATVDLETSVHTTARAMSDTPSKYDAVTFHLWQKEIEDCFIEDLMYVLPTEGCSKIPSHKVKFLKCSLQEGQGGAPRQMGLQSSPHLENP
uniref:Uncharacterized protein n=1 Tax=Timema poppense TaxID=170557 RepID=A0A7R9DF76_TIMPO|nr:unnamed protein product [Timema poppensis]